MCDVSVIIPVYNEEKYIDACVHSLRFQDFPRERMEWIFVDGASTDTTPERLEAFRKEFPELVRVLVNPKKIVPISMNLGIRQARGIYIVRLDAHSRYPSDYISRCISTLEQVPDADNVGGVLETKNQGFVGTAIAKMLSSRFGVGNSEFRTHGKSGFVDTVPFGAFRRSVFTRFGGYDERLVRNQDNELNYRIRKNGGRIYLSDQIHLTYHSRDTLSGIARMARENGKWNVITMKLCPGSMGVRHFVPLLFVLSLLILGIGGLFAPLLRMLLLIELAVYLALDLGASFRLASSLREFGLLLILFPLFHLSYGYGSLKGIIQLFSSRDWRDGEKPPIL